MKSPSKIKPTPVSREKKKQINLEINEAELFTLDELVEREFMRCMWHLKRDQLKKYMKILDSLGIKLSGLIQNKL